MVEQAKQIFYVQYPCDERWCMVVQGKTIGACVLHIFCCTKKNVYGSVWMRDEQEAKLPKL